MSKSGGRNGGSGGPKTRPKVDGRKATQFKPGNPGGPGNPFVKLSHRLRVAISSYSEKEHGSTRTYADELACQLWEMALGPTVEAKATAKRWAMQQVMDRGMGKAPLEIHTTAKVTVEHKHHQILEDATVRTALERARDRLGVTAN